MYISKLLSQIVIRFNVNPNVVTAMGTAGTIAGAIALVFDLRIIAIILIAIFSLFDAIDGKIARIQNKQSKLGKFLDSKM